MRSKWIWLVLFLVTLGVGATLWVERRKDDEFVTEKTAPKAEEKVVAPEGMSPQLESGQIEPPPSGYSSGPLQPKQPGEGQSEPVPPAPRADAGQPPGGLGEVPGAGDPYPGYFAPNYTPPGYTPPNPGLGYDPSYIPPGSEAYPAPSPYGGDDDLGVPPSTFEPGPPVEEYAPPEDY